MHLIPLLVDLLHCTVLDISQLPPYSLILPPSWTSGQVQAMVGKQIAIPKPGNLAAPPVGSRESTLTALTENLPPAGQASIRGTAPNEPEHEGTSSPEGSSSSSTEIAGDAMAAAKKTAL